MKVKVKKSELYECIENAVIRALNEASKKGSVKEAWYDDDDDDTVLGAFLRDKKNQLSPDDMAVARGKGSTKASRAAAKAGEEEMAASRKDDAAAEAKEKSEMSKD